MERKGKINALQKGRWSYLAAIQKKYWRKLHRFLRSRFHFNEAEIEDLTAATFVAFYENVLDGAFDTRDAMDSYLLTIAKRKAINLLNEKKRHQSKNEELFGENGLKLEQDLSELREDQQILVKKLIKQLPVDDARLITLFYYHRWTMEDIAMELGLKNADSAKDKKRRIIKKLQKLSEKLDI